VTDKKSLWMRTRVLPTDELVISEGFRKELMFWLNDLMKKEETKK